MSKADVILQKIKEEVISSLNKHPKWSECPFHALSILGEEYGEVNQAALEHYKPKPNVSSDELRNELIQLAAMCVRMIDGVEKTPFGYYCKPQMQQSDLVEPSEKSYFDPDSGRYCGPAAIKAGKATVKVVDAKGNEHTLGTTTNPVIKSMSRTFSYICVHGRTEMVNAGYITPRIWCDREIGVDVPSEWSLLKVVRDRSNSKEHRLAFQSNGVTIVRPAHHIARIGQWVITRLDHSALASLKSKSSHPYASPGR